MVHSRDQIEDIVVISEATERYLNQRQLEDYHDHRVSLIKWLCHLGKDPEKAEGYAYDTARQRAYKIDRFYRWLWDYEDGYTLHATTDHADAYTKELVYEDHSETYKAGIQKAIKTLFKYLNHEKGRNIDWGPVIKFTNGGSQTHQIRDFLTEDERRRIKQAVLEHGSIPHYNSVDPRERDRCKAYLAQRFEKPKGEVTKDDWERANGWNTLRLSTPRWTLASARKRLPGEGKLAGFGEQPLPHPEGGVDEESRQLARRDERPHRKLSSEVALRTRELREVSQVRCTLAHALRQSLRLRIAQSITPEIL